MKANKFLVASVQQNRVIIRCGGPAGIGLSLVGATCPTLPNPSFERTFPFFEVILDPRKDALIAVLVRTQGHGYRFDHGFLVVIRWEDGKVVADLESAPTFSPDRSGILTSEVGCDVLEVVCGGQRFASFHRVSDSKELPANYGQCRTVADPNLLCQFLNGELTVEELEALSTADKRTATELELAIVREKLLTAEKKVNEKNEQLYSQACSNRELRESMVKLEAMFHDASNGRSRLAEILNGIFQACCNCDTQRTMFGFFPWSKLTKIKHLLYLWKNPPLTK